MKKHFLLLVMALMSLTSWATDINDVKASIGDIVYGSTTAPGLLITYDVALTEGTHYSWDRKYYTDAACTNEAKDPTTETPYTYSQLPINTYYTKIVGISSGGFSGEKLLSFKVTAKPLSGSFGVDVTGGPFTYDGTAKTFTTVALIEYAEKTFASDGSDWSTTGIYTEAAGVYTPVESTASYNATKTYYTKVGTLTPTTDYTLVYSDNIAAGTNTAKITFTGAGNYGDTKVYTFSIAAKALPSYSTTAYSFAALGTGENPVYSASPVTTLPTFVVKDGSKTLTKDVDYEVRWYQNISSVKTYVSVTDATTGVTTYPSPTNAGTYYGEIWGKGNYTTSAGITPTTATDWTVTVDPKPIKGYIQSKEKTYDGEAIPTTSGTIDVTTSDIVLIGLCTADNTDAIKTGITAVFVNPTYNTTPPVNAGAYGMKPDFSGATKLGNYAPTALETGIYTINKRQVTVTAEKQTLTYTGATLTPDLTIRTSATTAGPKTVTIEAAKYDTSVTPAVLLSTSTTGLIKGDDITDLFELSQKSGVTIQDKGPYTGAIEIIDPQPNATATPPVTAEDIATLLANANYTVVGVAGDVEVAGQALTLIAGTFSKEYGYTIDFTKDFNVVNTGGIKNDGWKTAPTYKVTNSEGVEVTAATGVLPRGIYTIELTNAEAIVPDNYEYKADLVYTGELTIVQKDPKFTAATVNLNTGDGIEELLKYLTVEYEAVGDEEIAYEVAFASGILGTDDKLQAASAYTLDTNGDIANAVEIKFIQPGTAGKDAKDNANYALDYTTAGTVKVKIHLGAAATLYLSNTDKQLEGKIADANGMDYTPKFSGINTLNKEWYAMVLPFAVTPAMLCKALDTYVILNRLSDTSTLDNIVFGVEFDEVPAGEPFLIKVVGNNAAVPATTTTAAVEAGTFCDWSKATFAAQTIVSAITPVETAAATFTGTYNSTTVIKYDPDDATATKYQWLAQTNYKKDNNWKKPKSNAHTVNPMEAYLILAAGSSYAPTITVEDFDGQTTAIQTLNAGSINNLKTNEGWYDLRGVKLQSAPTQKGVYINNGKKVIIK